ncbi:exonuclease domain-containing protein [Streptomyces sp. NPDC088729]|uniref:exonuclease domain-containing protein n=1 Tax=Streptomyces sp. NPDC088729 TaxID=3365876 RepID=UPI003827B385
MTDPAVSGWPDKPMLALDLETTGLNPETARIVAAATVLVGTGPAPAVTEWLVDPGLAIPAEAAAIHGITTEQAQAHGRPPADVIPEIISVVTDTVGQGFPVVVFRAPYALTVLAREAARHGVDFPADMAPVIDPSVLDKEAAPYRRGRRTLPALCEHYQVRHDGPNRPVEDALAAARLTWRMTRVHPQFAALDLPTLHARQQTWAAGQAAGLQSYLRRTDPTAVVHGDWPVIPNSEEKT